MEIARMLGRAGELEHRASLLELEADSRRRQAAGLRQQALTEALLSQRPANRRSLLVRLMQADVLLLVVSQLAALEDRAALAASCKLVHEHSRHLQEHWFSCGQQQSLACRLPTAAAAQSLWDLFILPQLPRLAEVALHFSADLGEASSKRGVVLFVLRELPSLARLHLEVAAGMGAHEDWMLPGLTTLRGLRLCKHGEPGLFLVDRREQAFPRLEWAELGGARADRFGRDNSLLAAVCASTQLTRLQLERCNLAEDGPGVLAECTQLRHLEMRDVSLPTGCRHGITVLAQLTALHLPAHGAEWDEPLETLGPLTALRQLSLHGEDCSAQVLASLPTSLTSLSLDFTGQAGRPPLAQLERLSSLRQLWLGPAALIHGRGAARLRKAIPGLLLEVA
ncbi:hypothetical protein ABPG75_008630 [Micractinium tetrahymenae]